MKRYVEKVCKRAGSIKVPKETQPPILHMDPPEASGPISATLIQQIQKNKMLLPSKRETVFSRGEFCIYVKHPSGKYAVMNLMLCIRGIFWCVVKSESGHFIVVEYKS